MGQGLLGLDPDLSMQLGLGLLAAGGRHLAGQSPVSDIQGAIGNYYGQKQAKAQLAQSQIANQMAMQKMGLLRQAAQQYLAGAQPGAQMPQPPQGQGAQPMQGAPMPAPGSGAAPAGGAPMQPQMPSWFTPPSPQQINQMPIGGVNPNYDRLNAIAEGKDRLTVEKQITDEQRAAAQQQYAPTLQKLRDLYKSSDPLKAVKADPSLQAAWGIAAKQLGYDPVNDLNDTNVRTALGYTHNQLAAPIGAPTLDLTARMIQGTAPDGRPTQTDPMTGKVTYEAAGPNVITAEDKIKNNMEQQRLALEQRQRQLEIDRVGVPNGYEKDPDNPGNLRPIAGGPSDPNAVGSGMGARNEVMFQRVANAGNAAAESIKNIGELPIGTSTGWFGTAHPGTSLLGSVKGVLTQKMNSQDVQDYQTMLAGVSRNLATLETSGLAPGGSLTHSMDALVMGEGDTHLAKLRKMAEMRQIIDTNLTPQLSNPKTPQPQKDMVRGIIAKVDDAVPFTHSDITRFEQSTNPRATIMDFARSKGLTGNGAPVGSQSSLAAAAAAELKRRQQAGN